MLNLKLNYNHEGRYNDAIIDIPKVKLEASSF